MTVINKLTLILCLMLIAINGHAQYDADDLTGVAFKPEQAAILSSNFPSVTSTTSVTATTTITAGTGLTVTTGDLTMSGGVVVQTEVQFIPAARGRAGATAGVGFVNTGTDTMMVTLAQSATADTWVVPLDGVHVGDTVTGAKLIGQIESAGNTVTVDMALRKVTMAAADPADAAFDSACAITQISKTADYEIADSVTGCSEVLATGEAFYALITVTTGATTDVQLAGIELTLTKGN